MKNILIVFRFFFKDTKNSIIKILSLGAGLAMALVLISKIYFDVSYDSFYPDAQRIYKIQANHTIDDKKLVGGSAISGGVAVGMKTEIPSVEAATRYTSVGRATLLSKDEKRYNGKVILADTCFFDVLPRPMILGDAKQTLSRPMHVLISETMAKAIGKGDNVIGEVLSVEEMPGAEIIIGGVFKDVPENSHYRYDVVLSLVTIPYIMSDGSNEWHGNERYLGYVKLLPGVSPESIADDVVKMQLKYQDMEMMKKAGVTTSYGFVPLTKVYSDIPENKRMRLMLTLLTFALLFTSVMNYILIVISSLVKRNREFAMYKCYGASTGKIINRMFLETFICMVFSIILAVCLIVVFRQTIESILHVSIFALFSNTAIVILLAICLIVFIATALVPSYIFSRIPVVFAFKNSTDSKRIWKKALLFVQFLMASFLLALLFIVGKQYNIMVNDNPGYQYENLLYCSTAGVSSLEREKAVEQLLQDPEIMAVSTSSELPIFSMSGNNVSEVGQDKEMFNFVDLYEVDENYLSLMEIEVLDGKSFERELCDSSSVMLSKSFADKVVKLLNWKDGVVGKTLYFSEHGVCNVVGIYSDIRIGSISDKESRPSALFYSKHKSKNILIKMRELSGDKILKVKNTLEKVMPGRILNPIPYKVEMVNIYADSLRFRNSVLIAGVIVLIISLIGLIGYTSDEIVRRSKEIAIRKVTGATAKDVIALLSKNVFYMAIIATVIGEIASFIIGRKWLEQFSEKVSLSPILFIGCGIITIAIIIVCVVVRSWSISNENPVKSIK